MDGRDFSGTIAFWVNSRLIVEVENKTKSTFEKMYSATQQNYLMRRLRTRILHSCPANGRHNPPKPPPLVEFSAILRDCAFFCACGTFFVLRIVAWQQYNSLDSAGVRFG
jgi:hypothetical protein